MPSSSRLGSRPSDVARWAYSARVSATSASSASLGAASGPPSRRGCDRHDTVAATDFATLPNRRKPSDDPSNSSHARSGWGIIPSTLRRSFTMPAISRIDPLGDPSPTGDRPAHIAKHHSLLALEHLERRPIGDVPPFAMRHRNLQHLPSRTPGR